MNSNILGNTIKQLRLEKDMNQKELASVLNISNTTLSQYETGQRIPSDEIKIKIAEFFSVSVDYLLLGNNQEKEIKSWKPQLTEKDEKDIEKILASTEQSLLSQEGLMFDGDHASPEAIESIINAMRFGMEQARLVNKKYTPKKYRKTESESTDD